MKRQIRFGVFESNSSSTHSLSIMMKSDYDRWKLEELYLYSNAYYFRRGSDAPKDGALYTKEEVIAFLEKYDRDQGYESPDYVTDEDAFYDNRKDAGFLLYGEGNESLESFYDEFTTPGGETVVAFGEYGYE